MAKLLEVYWKHFANDITYKLKNILEIPNLQIPKSQLKNHVMVELEKLLNKKYCSPLDYNLLGPIRVIT